MSDYDMNDGAFETSIALDDTLLLADSDKTSEDKPDMAWPKTQMLDRLRTCD